MQTQEVAPGLACSSGADGWRTFGIVVIVLNVLLILLLLLCAWRLLHPGRTRGRTADRQAAKPASADAPPPAVPIRTRVPPPEPEPESPSAALAESVAGLLEVRHRASIDGGRERRRPNEKRVALHARPHTHAHTHTDLACQPRKWPVASKIGI